MTILTDEEILTAMKSGMLIKEGDYGLIGPACYELRAGPIYYDLTEGSTRIDATAQKTILIKPGHRVVLITLEQLDISNDIFARISSKGSLFSIGLSAVSTYADPGFSGHIGIVTQNMSDKYIVLPIKQTIAKVDFSRLSRNVKKNYIGQHGYHSQIWPIRNDLQKTYGEIKNDTRVGSEDEEAGKVIPAATVLALKKIQMDQRSLKQSLILITLVNILMFAIVLDINRTEFWFAISTNLLASAVFAFPNYNPLKK
ncbi:dCTP deaminase domain-containing protein [Paracidovorax valerianellae]|uniref:dCTP deaminase n=1 Tax=Paracidovorax valerianellae TaxID=187868 RepID=A0A1G6JZD7_9BURK|nr:hypothetical protein [Paracidovorax valerianellae]MDA8445228.1 hypothetical protein [Paracidovorax valerianellae]SDC23951.1 dCTP deaminase [Paracidovorax valerianellae]